MDVKQSLLAVLVFIAIIWVFLGGGVRGYYEDDGTLMMAWHVPFPGYAYKGYSENIVEPEAYEIWLGFRDPENLVLNPDGTENVEGTTLRALQAVGIYGPEYELELRPDGHYVLRRPAHRERYFTWETWYQVWPGTPAET